MSNEIIIQNYSNLVSDSNKILSESLRKLNETKEAIVIDLEIVIRMGYKIEENFIRIKLEAILNTINILEKAKIYIPDNMSKQLIL